MRTELLSYRGTSRFKPKGEVRSLEYVGKTSILHPNKSQHSLKRYKQTLFYIHKGSRQFED